MYGFEPSEEQKTLVETVRRYAQRELRPHLREADESGRLPEKATRSGWEQGLLPASLPEEFGGFGERSVVTGALAAEELAWGDLAGALALMAPNLVAHSLFCSEGARSRGRSCCPPSPARRRGCPAHHRPQDPRLRQQGAEVGHLDH